MSLPIQEFDFDRFEPHWETLQTEQKEYFIKEASKLAPEYAILPILAGITSSHPTLKKDAQKGLEAIQSFIIDLFADPHQHQRTMNLSTQVCAKLYSHIHPGMDSDTLDYLFQALLRLEGKGAHFAFKAVDQGLVPMNVMEENIFMVPEPRRLAFVDQYLQTGPVTRLKFGEFFKQILKSITQKKSVVEFYAGLFDQQRDVDPFLNNIPPKVRGLNPAMISKIRSAEVKVMGLKALAMILAKLPPDLLIEILSENPDKKTRIAIYGIIENSSLGTYPELFFPILQFFYDRDREEAFHAFKALAVSGKFPLYRLLMMVQNRYPALMPIIHDEISALSKISFFFIQDIALNKKQYINSNFDVNLACVWGMIKKRPERVLNILRKHGTDKNNLAQFSQRIEDLLSREKESIETELDPIVEWVKTEAKGSTKEKIEAIKNNTQSGMVDFKGRTIQDVNISSSLFQSSFLVFSQCTIKNCNFSGTSFSNAFFKKTIFYNVNMRQTQFDTVNFDNAVFINVDATGAVFKNCSFQNSSIQNCDFSGAILKDACFLDSTISMTQFDQTDLSGSCFSHSKISLVSFVTSNTNQVDFSYVRARFCRFSSNAKSNRKTENLDYNHREYQISFKDMPRLNAPVMEEINMLIFCEFIHYGEMKFLKQNKLSLLTAFDIFNPGQLNLFQIIPLLLHENIGFPGFEKIPDQTPCGIYGYIPGRGVQEAMEEALGWSGMDIKARDAYSIEGLFTMGSTGSIAQTNDSDIDYWVCVNETIFNSREIALLKEKLEKLEEMARAQFHTKVTFFWVDIPKARDNDFGYSTVESSGSAQSRLLKEEFYRTMIYVAGKIPLWSVLPTVICRGYYDSIVRNVDISHNLARYIDLGDIHAISKSEYFGASIWQMFKWLGSPFKSVLKMALLEKYISEYGKQALLCNKYKDEWMNSGTHLKLAQNDSYFILLENLLNYFKAAKDLDSVTLLLTCFFQKLSISKDSQIDDTIFGLRKILLEKCMDQWGWTRDEIFKNGFLKDWPYTEVANFSNTIKRQMISKYKTVNKTFDQPVSGGAKITPEDRTALGRKVFIEFSKNSHKVEKVFLVSQWGRHFQRLHLKYIKNNNGIPLWELYYLNPKKVYNKEEFSVRTSTIEEMGAWLINNRLYNENAVIKLVGNRTYLTFSDIQKLYKTMYDFFNQALVKPIGFDHLLKPKQVTCLFVSLIYSTLKPQWKSNEYTVVYLNSWGEMFCESVYSHQGFSTVDDIKEDVMEKMDLKKLPPKTCFYFPGELNLEQQLFIDYNDLLKRH